MRATRPLCLVFVPLFTVYQPPPLVARPGDFSRKDGVLSYTCRDGDTPRAVLQRMVCFLGWQERNKTKELFAETLRVFLAALNKQQWGSRITSCAKMRRGSILTLVLSDYAENVESPTVFVAGNAGLSICAYACVCACINVRTPFIY